MQISSLASLYDNASNDAERQVYADAIMRAFDLNRDRDAKTYANKIAEWAIKNGFGRDGHGNRIGFLQTVRKVRDEQGSSLLDAKTWVERNIPGMAPTH